MEIGLKLYVKLLQKKLFVKFGLSRGKFWLLRTLGRNLHIFQDNFEFRVENKKRRNLPEEVVVSPKSAKDFKRFHSFAFLFLLVFALFSKSSFLDT